MANLRQDIANVTKNRRFRGAIIDTVNNRVSVKMLSGRVLTGIPFSGSKPAKGDTVYVDYTTGSPVVYGGSANVVSHATPVTPSKKQTLVDADGGGVQANDAHSLWGIPLSGDGPVAGDTYIFSAATGKFELAQSSVAKAKATRWEPLTNGDPENPELVYFNGDIMMVEAPL